MLKEFKVRVEACDGETADETPASDTQQETADEASQEDSSKKKKKGKKKRKLNEAEDPANISELFLDTCNSAWHDDNTAGVNQAESFRSV